MSETFSPEKRGTGGEDSRELLYISDLDGTLLPPGGVLSQEMIRRLNQLIDRGLNFTIATARNYDSVYPLLRGLNLKLPVILFNGVYLTEFHSGRNVLLSHFISDHILEEVMGVVEPLEMDPFVYTYGEDHRVYYRNAQNAGARNYLRYLDGDPRVRKVEEYRFPPSERVSGFLLIDTREALEPVYQLLAQRYSNHLNLYFAEDLAAKGYYWLQSFHQQADKGRMVKRLATHLNTPLSRVVVFGDYLNDLEMFRVAGRAVAVANALPEVKENAHEIIGSNETGAVIDYLESLGFED